MKRAALLVLVCLVGCASEPPAPPPVPPAPEDLSHWSVPELVQLPPPPTPVPPVAKEKTTPAESVLEYAPSATYTLSVAVGTPLDVVLEKGEQLRNIVGGEKTPVEAPQGQGTEGAAKSPWDLKEGAEGLADSLRSHLFITATKPGLTLGLVLTTTKRVYYITCKSVKTSLLRTVRWKYAEPLTPVVKAREPGLLPDPETPKRYHVGYELTSAQAHPPDWLPRYTLDDGKKLYLVLPEITLFETAPMVRMIGPNGPALVNARQFLNVIIVDQLAPRLELRVGLGATAEVVTIARGALRTIQCPEAPECPVWPQAAQVLARKGTPPVLQKHVETVPLPQAPEGEAP